MQKFFSSIVGNKNFDYKINYLLSQSFVKSSIIIKGSNNFIFLFPKCFGTYGAVTKKRQERREKLYEEKYKHNPNNIPKYSKVKRGSRGGWIHNPLKELTKNNGTNFMYEQKINEEISEKEKACINTLINFRKKITNSNHNVDTIIDINKFGNNITERTAVHNIKNNNTDSYDIANSNSDHMLGLKELPNADLFTVCENFIDSKKQIIQKIENPDHFVNTHIKSLVNEYTNINHLHEDMNVYKYAKVPDYLKKDKDDSNVTNKHISDSLDLNEQNDSIKHGMWSDKHDIVTGINIHSAKQIDAKNKDICNSEKIRSKTKFIDKKKNTNKLDYNFNRMNKNALNEQSIKDGNDFMYISDDTEQLEIDLMNKYNNIDNKCSNKNTQNVNINMEEQRENSNDALDDNTLKNMYIDNFLNYSDDETNLDITCLDVFTALNTIDRNKKLSLFFKTIKDTSFIFYNNCIIPSKFGKGTLNEYFHTRKKCSLFDKSYQQIIKFYGSDCFYICNQFISCNLYEMYNSDVSYTCILDNKAYIIDTGYVLKGKNEIILITSGYYKKGVYEYLSDYILFCRDSGMDVHIEAMLNKRIISIQGPLSNLAFNDILDFYDYNNKQKKIKLTYLKNVIEDADNSINHNETKSPDDSNITEHMLYFKQSKEKNEYLNMPYMSFKKMPILMGGTDKSSANMDNTSTDSTDKSIASTENTSTDSTDKSSASTENTSTDSTNIEKNKAYQINEPVNEYEIICIRIGDTGEDGYEFIIDNHVSDIYVKLLLKHKFIEMAGAYALDILRMEAGFPLYGVDIIKNITPLTASLAWTLKYKKIKERNIFGYEKLLKEYTMKPKFIRVGIICNELVFKTCKILSYPYKEPIGYITSCTWSPVYKKRIAQGYIKREFAKNNEKILISIPVEIPQHLSKKKKYKILRSRSSRKFAFAQVRALPFVQHNYITT
ncbi:aminomethyltransferase, putative [Hepatocystis sp. ex Piliocolobus tephrosceles]|nr:aminomethyltransferase, putative [Hepatocystis sp. ex Piliocolobus tephrosceles]